MHQLLAFSCTHTEETTEMTSTVPCCDTFCFSNMSAFINLRTQPHVTLNPIDCCWPPSLTSRATLRPFPSCPGHPLHVSHLYLILSAHMSLLTGEKLVSAYITTQMPTVFCFATVPLTPDVSKLRLEPQQNNNDL